MLIILSQFLYNSSATFYFSIVYSFFTNEEYYYECNINLLITILIINDTSRKQYYMFHNHLKKNIFFLNINYGIRRIIVTLLKPVNYRIYLSVYQLI